MRVLLTTYAERTHLLLMVPLAWALRTSGHDVLVAVQPKLVADVTRAGLTAVPIGSDRDLWTVLDRIAPEAWIGAGTGWAPPYDTANAEPATIKFTALHDGYRDNAIRWHKSSNVPLVADLVEFARYWKPDLIIWEATTYAGAIAAKACGAVHARVLVGMDVFGITRERFLGLRPSIDSSDPLGDWLGSYAHKYGRAFTEDMVTGQFTVDHLPISLSDQTALKRVPMRYVGYGGPATVPAWLSGTVERTRVALTMGLTASDRTGGYPVNLQDILSSISDLDIEVVATVRDDVRERFRSIPENVRLVSYVPLFPLLETCSVVIHHTGVGTLCTAALCAVPQLAIPWDVDQPVLASRLVDQGAGLSLPAVTASGPTVRDNLLRLIEEPSFQRSADQLRAEMLAMPAPRDVVRTIEQLTFELAERSNQHS